MTMSLKNAVLVAIAVQLAIPVAAQYRDNQPPVAAPPPPPAAFDDRPAIDAFRAAYQKAGQPRIVVFWNRTLSDEIADARVKQTTIQSKGSSQSNRMEDSTQGPSGSGKLVERSAQSGRETIIREGEIVTNANSRGGPEERLMWTIESEFANQLARAGVLLVDRATIIRTTHLAQPATSDPRQIETAALEGKADLLMEILLGPDAQAPSGSIYRVTVKSVKTGVQLVNFVTQARPPANGGNRGYVATDKGFARAGAPPPPSINEVARALGYETMQQLTPRLIPESPKKR
jgi:hypothetical protein